MLRIWVGHLAHGYFLRTFHNGCHLVQIWFDRKFLPVLCLAS